ncbi:MAG: MBL fold metallo-hydrolase [Polyangiales bacterium]
MATSSGWRQAWRRAGRVAAVALAIAIALLAWSFAPSPLPPVAPWRGALPAAHPPAAMAVFALPTGVTHRSAAFAYRGGSFRDARDFAMCATLVRHPRGDVLIDTGFGRHVDAHLRRMPLAFRAITRYTRGRAVVEQLDAAGYDRTRLRAILLTHAHWDHVSGLEDLPDTPVWVTATERRFIEEGGALSAVARSLPAARFVSYAFDGPPYLGFPASHDVYGDGAIVVVPAPGHTPGSVIVFLALPGGRRFALLGDLVWQLEGITRREERPWVQRTLGDHTPAAVRTQILRVAALSAAFPSMVLVPAHDRRGFAQMPVWPGAGAR